MKKIVSSLILMMILVISGCSNREVIEHHYTYFGENDLWSAEYKVDSTVTVSKNKGKINSASNRDSIMTVTYKKALSDLEKIKDITISYDFVGGSYSLSSHYEEGESPSNNVFTLKSSDTGSVIENEDESISVTINIDGEIQTIELTNAK